MAKKYNSKIELLVQLDENKIPEKLKWSAEDGGIENEETKAIFYPFGILKRKNH